MTNQDPFGELVAAFSGRSGVTLGGGKRGFGSDALQVDGRIFAMYKRGGLVLKLPDERVRQLVASGSGAPFDGGKGRPMKSWVVLNAGADLDWPALAEEALAYVQSP